MMAPLWSDKRPADFETTLAEAFDAAVRTYPTRIAVDTGQRRTSFLDLQAAADSLARRLTDAGGGPSDRVAVLMDHDAPAIAAVVGVAKAGRVVLGLNCSDPVDRLRQLIQDAEPAVIVADARNSDLAVQIATSHSRTVIFSLDDDSTGGAGPLPAPADSGDTVAIVYTSGSTGRPKGVMKTHRQICRNVATHSQAMSYTSADRIPLFSSIGTGQGTTVVWCALLNGATLCPFSIRTKGFAGLPEWISDLGLTVFVSSASILRTLVRSLDDGVVFDRIRAVRLASESVTANDVGLARRHFPEDCFFVHTLSSSETGNIAWSRWRAGDEIAGERLPVGHVSRDIEVLLLNEDGQQVGTGETGEIAVKSRYAAAGYWRDPDLTAERFLPVQDGSGRRLVRSGDLARLDAAGRLEFRGRKDDRIKIRGNRIELADVEWALSKVPGVERAAAVVLPRDASEPMLVAFVVMSPHASLSPRQVRQAAAINMPLQMLPSRIVFLEALPMGPSGKVDKALLRSHALPRQDAGDPPRGATETAIADIWAEALDVATLGRDVDFFEAGGDSLKAAVVAAELHAAFGIGLSLAALAANPTVAALAAHVEAEAGAPGQSLPAITRVSRDRPHPLSPYQQRVWRALELTQSHATLVRSYAIAGPLDRAAMEKAFRFLVARHEILRTTFAVVDGEPAQIVHASAPLGFSFVDVSGEDDPVAAAEAICAKQVVRPVDPSVLPILRLLLVRLGAEEHWLLRVGHALGQDASSFTMIMNEFASLYEAEVRGLPPPITRDLPLQYVDFAVWHRQVMRPDGPAFQDTLNWWKGVFARRLRTTRLPFREHRGSGGGAAAHATHLWQIDPGQAERLDETARRAGATYFVARLACFVALLAHLGGKSPVVIGSSFTSRQRSETGGIAGLFTNMAPLAVPYRPELGLRDWLRSVRDRVFETERHADIPLETLYESLRREGLRLPPIKALFTMASDWSEQRISGITISRRPHPLPEMPWGFQMFVDKGTPSNCRIEFDANRYRPDDIRSFAASYVRLLEAAAANPDLSIGELVTMAQGERAGGVVARLRRAFSRN